MPETPSERRLAENEVLFRQLNEQVHHGFEETNRLAREDGQPEYIVDPQADIPLHFYCECADEKCTERIVMALPTYTAIHQYDNRFVIVPGHEVASVEKVILRRPEYLVVQKYVKPPKVARKLHPTSLRNG
jgi:hypothetical protein